MQSKKANSDLGLGEFIVPIIDLLSIIIMKVADLVGVLLMYLFNQVFFNNKKEEDVKKIEREDLSIKKSTLDDDALGYSVGRKRVIKVSEIEKKRHSMVCGASGFGKTVLLDVLLYDDLKNDRPVIFIDPKGDNKSLNQFINLCKITGRDYQIFSKSYSGHGSISLNSAKEGSFTNVADRIHYSFDWSEEHYEILCYRALKKSCKLLKEKNELISYEKILDTLIENSNPKDKDRIFDRKDIEGIITRLENIIDSDFGDKLDAKGLSFKEIWQSKKCVYIALPVLGYPKIARSLGKLFLGDLSYSAFEAYDQLTVENEKNLNPVGIYIDELSAVITDEFIELLNKCRGVKMELNFAFQSPSDIKKIDPELLEQIFENTSNWFIGKQRMENGANVFSEAIGTILGKKQTIRVEDGVEKDQGSQRKVEELIVHHNIIKNLNVGQGVLLRHSPTKIDLINFKFIDPITVSKNVRFLEKIGFLDKKESAVKNKKGVSSIL